MPQKQPSAKSNADQQTKPLHALVLTDSYQTTFEPFTLEKPRCLLPLADTPLIEYTLKFLTSVGVEHVFIFCGNHADQVVSYFANSIWTSNTSPFLSCTVIASEATSFGDAMREIALQNLFESDFLLVYGDIVSNIRLDDAIAAHQQRRKADKEAIMTIVLRAPSGNPSHSPQVARKLNSPFFAIDPVSQRCLQYETLRPSAPSNITTIDPAAFALTTCDFRADLIDCGIDICDPEFLKMWNDNFDFQSPRDNFLHSILRDYELNRKKIYTHIVDRGYATRASSIFQYAQLANDIVARRSHPYTPDFNFLPSHSFTFCRNTRTYLNHQNLSIARSATILPRSVIASSCTIGNNTVISDSFIGPDCKIADNVTIRNSHIWSNVTIGPHTEIDTAIVADNVTIGKGCTLEPGSLLSFGVKLNMNVTICGPHCAMVRPHLVPDALTSVIETSEGPRTVGLAGEAVPSSIGHGIVIPGDDTTNTGLVPSGAYARAVRDAANHDNSSVFSADLSDESEVEIDGEDDQKYIDEATVYLEGVLRETKYGEDIDEKHIEDILLNFKNFRVTLNASPHSVRTAVCRSFVTHITASIAKGKPIEAAVDDSIETYAEIWKCSVFDQEEEDKPDQTDLLLCFQNELKDKPSPGDILLYALLALSHSKAVQNAGIFQWWESKESSFTDHQRLTREKAKVAIVVLRQDENDKQVEESTEEDGSSGEDEVDDDESDEN